MIKDSEPSFLGAPPDGGREEEVFGRNPPERVLPLKGLLDSIHEVVDQVYSEFVWIEAEVARWKPHSSGHIYLELVQRTPQGKEVAKANARIWGTHAQSVKQKFKRETGEDLREGMTVQWLVRPDFSPQYGFGLTLIDLYPLWTPGQHEQQKERIRQSLKQQKIWDAQRQWPTPSVLTRLAILAPSDAAGLGDFLSEAKIWAAGRLVEISVFQATFEGEKASGSISQRLQQMAFAQMEAFRQTGHSAWDVVVLLRGGGSKTSLAWLDDEAILAAVLKFPGPVWCAVGHEQDWGLLDEVCSVSFHTPSKASQRVWEMLSQELSQAAQIWDRFNLEVLAREELLNHQVEELWGGIRESSLRRHEQLSQRVEDRMREAMGLGPVATLERGYALIQEMDGSGVSRVIRKKEGILLPAKWKVTWQDGSLDVQVNEQQKFLQDNKQEFIREKN